MSFLFSKYELLLLLSSPKLKIFSNKVDIVTKANSNVEKEEKENNTSVQNTIITVSTGATAKVILVVIVIVSIGIGLRYGKVIIAKFDGGKVYKSKEKKKKITE